MAENHPSPFSVLTDILISGTTTDIISASRKKGEKKKDEKKKTSALLLRNVSVVVQLQSAHKRRWEVPAEVSDSMIT